MNQPSRSVVAENPFSASRLRPGAMPYLFADGQDARQFVERLRNAGWWAAIVGPHGSGKSALLAMLVPQIEQAGRQTVLVELHDGQRRMPLDLRRELQPDTSGVLIVDGFEQLGFLSRISVKRTCRRRRWGLLVTAHEPVGLPELLRTEVDLDAAEQIVRRLQRGYPPLVTAEDVAEPFSRHAGNVREMLFEFYDMYERRRR